MADYDSDSSGTNDVQTNVLLGYASREATLDDFSQLGGHPTWLDGTTAPNGALAKCRVCNGLMSLLLQLYGDLPARFPGRQRRLYIFACRRKQCRRKDGSIRGFRATYTESQTPASSQSEAQQDLESPAAASSGPPPATSLGETLFGVKSLAAPQANPFVSSAMSIGASFPSSCPASASKKPTAVAMDSLSQTFAQKASIATLTSDRNASPKTSQPWPPQSDFPNSFSSYHVDADTEYLEHESLSDPSLARLDRGSTNGEGSSTADDDKAAFESSMDKTFQRFADSLAQNPEQILRYEFGGQPLLYSRSDTVGKLLGIDQGRHANVKVQVSANGERSSSSSSRIPRCTNCGSSRVFELQLTPHAIAELEADELSIDGMDWGTIIIGCCSQDCVERGKDSGEVSYVEEWVGVQWEELAEQRRH